MEWDIDRCPVTTRIARLVEGRLTGQLLIAMPAMNTPHFAQTVIYMCAHTSEGAMGIVVNRPITRPSFDDLLEQLEVLPAPPLRRVELFRGGPVDSRAASCCIPAIGPVRAACRSMTMWR